jgi:hypothetical protein
MKLLVLLLATASLAVVPAAVLAPGQGDAAAAVAAHNKGAPQGAHQNGTQDGGSTVFELTGSGSILHSHDNLPGDKPFKSKVKAGDIATCVQGTAQGCTPSTIEVDAGGKAFLFFDSTTAWRIATNGAGTNATDLVGTVDGKGGFAFAGTDALSGTSFYLTGKVKLQKGQPDFQPLSLSGKITAVCPVQGHYGTGSFKGTLAVQ